VVTAIAAQARALGADSTGPIASAFLRKL